VRQQKGGIRAAGDESNFPVVQSREGWVSHPGWPVVVESVVINRCCLSAGHVERKTLVGGFSIQ
jgi:hypothetical protein